MKNLLIVAGAIAVVVLGLVLLTGGGDDSDGTTAAEENVAVDLEITMDGPTGPNGTDYVFTPNEFTVPAGQEFTVRLVNIGTQQHRFRIGRIIDTNPMKIGETRVVTFVLTEPGEVQFFCPIYGPQAMSGTITVE